MVIWPLSGVDVAKLVARLLLRCSVRPVRLEEEDMLLDSLLDKDMNYFLAKGKKSKRKLEEDLSIGIRRKKIKSTKYSCSSGAIWID